MPIVPALPRNSLLPLVQKISPHAPSSGASCSASSSPCLCRLRIEGRPRHGTWTCSPIRRWSLPWASTCLSPPSSPADSSCVWSMSALKKDRGDKGKQIGERGMIIAFGFMAGGALRLSSAPRCTHPRFSRKSDVAPCYSLDGISQSVRHRCSSASGFESGFGSLKRRRRSGSTWAVRC